MAGSVENKKASNVPPVSKGSHFFKCVGHCAVVTVNCLEQFFMLLQNMDISTIKFYYERGDFQKWIRNVVGASELARRMDRIRGDISGENLRKQLLGIVQTCVVELRKRG
jgi:hypothetical protein